jgi:arylsulfatase A-like enzyme
MPFHLDAHGSGPDQCVVLRGGEHEDVRGFMRAADRSFLLLLSLIERLKTLGTWDDTTLVVTGDHGCNLGSWEKGLEFSLYQMRTQVPLFVKPARSAKIELPATGEIVQAHQLAVHTILSTFGLASEYSLKKSPRLGTYVTTETTHQPQNDDYAACLTTEAYRYFYRAKVDWKARQMSRFEGDSLFAFDARIGLYDESSSVAGREREMQIHFREIAEREFQQQLENSRIAAEGAKYVK